MRPLWSRRNVAYELFKTPLSYGYIVTRVSTYDTLFEDGQTQVFTSGPATRSSTRKVRRSYGRAVCRAGLPTVCASRRL